MKKTFYSNGKLLITGEYVVLDGAKAFALPTKFGQNLIIEEGHDRQIEWKSFDKDGTIWFEEVITFDEITIVTSTQVESIKNTLTAILRESFLLNPDFIDNSNGYKITTELTFLKSWGLGTSSTLINNIAQWTNVDAFELLKNSFGGSGYDIACAQNNTPILYQIQNNKPIVQNIDFNPSFTKNLYFIYLNKKQSSKAAIASYYGNQSNITKTIVAIDKVTESILATNDLKKFAYEIQKHETIMSDVLEMQTVQEIHFSDFKGVVKSLGAWGGDFVLAISKEDPTNYFNLKGFSTVIPYKDMIL